jgi:NAD(P)-dependent dehydrogenase (short-subunit alcohol dehydrogenase family)
MIAVPSRAMISNSVPLGWLGPPQEIAKAVVSLASDDSRYTTGTTCSWMPAWRRSGAKSGS